MTTEFNAVQGSRHVIEPLGYQLVRKTVRPGHGARSAWEQYEIHGHAVRFPSYTLRIPPVHNLESRQSYVMNELPPGCVRVPMDKYGEHPVLIAELIRFYDYMAQFGYFAYGYTIFKIEHVYILLDFSLFGSIQGEYVRFPGLRTRFHVRDAFAIFGIRVPEKIEEVTARFVYDPSRPPTAI